MLLNSQVFPKDIELRAEADLELHDLKLLLDGEAADPSVTVGGWVEARELCDECCLAGTIRSKQPEKFAGIDT